MTAIGVRRIARIAAVLLGGLLATLSGGAALAQYGQPPQGYPASNPAMQELAHQAMVNKIEQVEREVEQNPAVLSDPQFLAAHPSLGRFLAGHPEAASLIQQNPQAFFGAFNREHGQGQPPQSPPY